MSDRTLAQIAASLIVVPEGLTARELHVEAMTASMRASRTDLLDLREHLIAKARVYRDAAAALEAARALNLDDEREAGDDCEGHETTRGAIGSVFYCDGSCA
jgi:hypothetical protein